MKILETYKEEIPAYSLSYLVNGDSSGIDDTDIKNADDFMQWFYDRAKELGGTVTLSCGVEEPSFTHHPAFGLACDTVPCEIHIFGGDPP